MAGEALGEPVEDGGLLPLLAGPGPLPWPGSTVIAFADMVGSSVLIAADQAGTVKRWLSLLHGLFIPVAAAHGGRVLQAVGDSVIAGFADATAAARWAVEVQDRLVAEDARQRTTSQPAGVITLRIAIHQGEVTVRDGRIFGHAINLAARLQQFAEPGGILLTGQVHAAAAHILPRPARDMGVLDLRGFAEEVHGFAIDPVLRIFAPALRPGRSVAPSIAVLPFRNVSGDPTWGWFGDGMVEDIIVNLASLRELLVISRGTTLLYSGLDPDPRDVGRKLDVRYVLAGTVRRAGNRVRISAELCDSENGAALWVDRRDVHENELFELQDEIASRIVAGVAPQIRASEIARVRRKPPSELTAYDHLLRGLADMNTLDEAVFRSAYASLEASRAADPSFSLPVAWQARWHSLSSGQGWSADGRSGLETAGGLAARATQLDPHNAIALATFGHLRSFMFRDYDQGLAYLGRAIETCPNSQLAWALSSATLSYLGRGEEAVSHARQAIALSPFDTSLYLYHGYVALALYANNECEGSAGYCSLAAAERPGYRANLRLTVAALSGAGRLDEAREACRQLLRVEPNFTLSNYRNGQLPFRDATLRDRCLADLARAGVPA